MKNRVRINNLEVQELGPDKHALPDHVQLTVYEDDGSSSSIYMHINNFRNLAILVQNFESIFGESPIDKLRKVLKFDE